ncbi:uncharacterized protein [Centruroides vittatus]|uniref:uncharacterized protein n=2 Tax=Centruroides vittatus TaxID=120091 RepID=UPI00350EC29C
MVICCVIGCNASSLKNKGTSFFKIPGIICHQGSQTEELSRRRQTAWLSRINRKNFNTDKVNINTRVCQKHFISGKPSSLYDESSPDWVPTLHMGYESSHNLTANQERYERARNRKIQRAALEAEACTQPSTVKDADISTTAEMEEAEPLKSNAWVQTTSLLETVTCQTEFKVKDIESLQLECANLKTEVSLLKKTYVLNEEFFEGDDNKIRFFTGLSNFKLLSLVLNLCCKQIDHPNSRKLTPFQEMIVCLMRIRLNLSLEDLAYRFNISKATICRIFDKWLHILYIRLSRLIVWPERDVLQKTMPKEFKKTIGSKIAVIIDCFELFVERPSSLDARYLTWSQYKHHNTIKFLIGVTPQGSVSFISEPWGGRVSDKHLTEHSGLLKYLLPGDLVLADRGFNITDSVGITGAQLAVPAFTRGKQQLSALEVAESRKLSHLRIHVERVIGRIKNNFKILESTLPIEHVTLKGHDNVTSIEKIVHVSCSLINLCNSVVPFE